MSIVRSVRRCIIEADEELIPRINNGLVTVCGPHASIWAWLPNQQKYDKVLRLSKIETRDTDEGFVITGTLDMLTAQGLTGKAARHAFRVTERSCETCH